MQTASDNINAYDKQNGLERVRAYVREHFADELHTAQMAALAGYSKSHFQRLFHKVFGETLRDYIRRIRLEKSAWKWMNGCETSVTDIAYTCGFSSSQSFARAFKAHYGISPGQLTSDAGRRFIFQKKWQNLQSRYGEKYLLPKESGPDGKFIRIPSWTEDGKESFQELKVVDMPALRVACIRTITRPGSDELFRVMYDLADWAVPRGLFTGNARLFRAVHPIPDEEGRFTFDSCISVPEGVEVAKSSGVSIRHLPAGEYGVYHARLASMEESLKTWKRLILGWWISCYFSRYCRPYYEVYYNNPDFHPTRSFIMDICLPITTRRIK